MSSIPPAQRDRTASSNRDGLSFSQERIWVLERLHPRNPVHSVACGFRLSGELDTNGFQRAWDELLRRHEILRTEFHDVDGAPEPIVVQSVLSPLNVDELDDLPPEHRHTRVSQLARNEIHRPFDLSSAPLLRVSLWRVSPLEHVLLLVAHRMVCDEASLEVLIRELASRYGVTDSVELPPLRYVDYAIRQRQLAAADLSFWKQQLAGAPASLELPVDQLRPAAPSFRGSSQAFAIDNSLVEGLRSLAKNNGTGLFTILLAAFYVLLFRYSRQDDLVVGVPTSGRTDPNLETMVGPIASMIALRAHLSAAQKFVDVLNTVRVVAEEAFLHQNVPVEALLDQIQTRAGFKPQSSVPGCVHAAK